MPVARALPVLVLLSLSLAGCAASPEEPDELVAVTEEALPSGALGPALAGTYVTTNAYPIFGLERDGSYALYPYNPCLGRTCRPPERGTWGLYQGSGGTRYIALRPSNGSWRWLRVDATPWPAVLTGVVGLGGCFTQET